jgi:hypothetical protein
MVLGGFSGTLAGAAATTGFRAGGLALDLLGATALGLTGAAAWTVSGFGLAFGVALAGKGAALPAVVFGAVFDFTGATAFTAGFLALLAAGLLTGFLAAVATIDSSVVDTALKN